MFPLPPGAPGFTNAEYGAGLQLALWALEYNPKGDLNIDDLANPAEPFAVQSTTDPNIITVAKDYLADAAGKQEFLYFLNMPAPDPNINSSNGQGVLSTDLLDFTNTPKASPGIATQASQVGNVVGTAVLSDSVIVTGGDSPSGMVTFTLTAPDGTTARSAR